MKSTSTDVLVVGGGPAGSGIAARLADAGHDVTVVEARREPTAVPRGNVLVPGAVHELRSLGIEADDMASHPILGTRMCFGGRSIPVRWPTTRTGTFDGLTVSRGELDRAVHARATAAGARIHRGARATTALVERGLVRGATIEFDDGSTTEIRCRFLVVADGANSRFGRNLGTHRDRRWPSAISTSTTVHSERADEHWVEAHLGPPDANGTPVTGHGWVSPMGDGRLNIGVTLLSSYRDVMSVNPLALLDQFVDSVAETWQFDPTERLIKPARWRTPVGGSVSPTMGPTFLVVGDAGGLVNPFNSHGVGTALRTAHIAAEVLDEALTVGNSTALQRYPARLDDEFGEYHKAGRLSARFLGRPWMLRQALRFGIRSETAMGAALRIATGELRERGGSGAERAYRLALLLARFAPNW